MGGSIPPPPPEGGVEGVNNFNWGGGGAVKKPDYNMYYFSHQILQVTDYKEVEKFGPLPEVLLDRKASYVIQSLIKVSTHFLKIEL